MKKDKLTNPTRKLTEKQMEVTDYFEEYLINKHAEQYRGTSDMLPDDYYDWFESLDPQEIVDYAQEWGDGLISKPEQVDKVDSEQVEPDIELKKASNGQDFMNLAYRILHGETNDAVKVAGLYNIIENVYAKINKLPHIRESKKQAVEDRETEYQNVLDFVTWVILNKNDLEVAHDFDEYCKKKNLILESSDNRGNK